MTFILGIIIGILLCGLLLLYEIYHFLKNGKTVINDFDKGVLSLLPKQQAVIIQPPTEAQDALQAIFDKNDELGDDTKLNDIL